MKLKNLIFNEISIPAYASLLISPTLLYLYLNSIGSVNFFSFLSYDRILPPYLIYILIFWFITIAALYLIPIIVFRLIKWMVMTSNQINIKIPTKIYSASYLIVVISNPFLIFSMTYTPEGSISFIIMCMILLFNFRLFYSYRFNIKEKEQKKITQNIFLQSSVIFIISLMPLYFLNECIFSSSIIPTAICISFVIIFTIRNFNNTLTSMRFFISILAKFRVKAYFRYILKNKKNIDRFILSFLISMLMLLSSSILVLSIANNLDGDMKMNDAFIPFSILCLFLYIIPNLIILASVLTKKQKVTVTISYIIFILIFTNIPEIVAYKTFDSIAFINKNKIEITSKKWHDADTPIPTTLNKIQMTAFNAFQTPTHSIFCNYDDIKLLTTKIEFYFFRPEKNHSKCIFVNNDDVSLVEKDKFIKITPTSEEPTLHQYQHL